MAKIGKLFLDFEAGTAKFNGPIKKAGGTLNRFGGQTKKTQTSLRRLDTGIKRTISNFKGLLIIGVVLAGIRKFNTALGTSIQRIDKLAKTSAKLGTTTESLRSLQVAGELTGVGVDKLNMAVQRATRRIAEAARGTGEAVNALAELNLEADVLNKLPLDEKIGAIADAFAKVENPADRVRLAMKLFDSEGVDLVNTLALGSEALQELRKELERYGVLVSKQDAAKVEQLNDAWTSMKLAVEGIANTVLTAVAPILTDMVINTRNWIIAFRNVIKVIDDAATAIVSNLVAQGFNALIISLERASGLFIALGGHSQVMAGVAVSAFKFVIATIDKMMDATENRINSLLRAINDNPFLTPGFDLPLVSVFSESRDKVIDELDKLANDLKTRGAKKLQEGIEQFINPVGVSIEEVQETIQTALEEFISSGQTAGTVFKSLGGTIGETADEIDNLKDKAEEFNDELSTGLARGIVLGDTFSDVLKRIGQQFAISGLERFIGSLIPESFGGSLAGLLGFGGKKAAGGPVLGGRSFLVGERGPELFTPQSSGTITPSHRMAQGGPVVHQTNHFDIKNDTDLQRVIATTVDTSVRLALAAHSNLRNRNAINA